MQKHEWLGNNATAFIFQFSMRNAVENNYYLVRFIAELEANGGDRILANQVNHSIITPSKKGFAMVILISMLILNILYTLKMFLEFNLVLNKWTFMGHMINIIASWAYTGFSLAIQIL